MSDQKLNSMKLDVLREIGNIGAGNATTALSVMLNSGLKVEAPVVKMLDFDEIPDMIGG
ncbi:MAG: CheY-P-specific phosphatase CheC, partial [Clostridiales bacterium]|nr:CheY-P-specific phosphatase CheC [Clostridiales bacterium]